MEALISTVITFSFGALVGLILSNVLDRFDVLYTCPRCQWSKWSYDEAKKRNNDFKED